MYVSCSGYSVQVVTITALTQMGKSLVISCQARILYKYWKDEGGFKLFCTAHLTADKQ